MITVRCPHCGNMFYFDQSKATVSTGPTGDASPEVDGSSLVYRPECPACDRRVTVRVRTSDSVA
jgi:DNA-directed RNA polymerase subunit RPC12/RpoP